MSIKYPWENMKELRISDSSLATFRSCPRKLEFRKMYGHGGRDDNINTGSGTAIHDGYQEFKVSGDRDKAIVAMMKSYPWLYNDSPYHGKSVEACYYTLEAMITHESLDDYEIAQIKCSDGVVRPAVEVPFEIEILGFDLLPGHDIKIIYVGRIDLILYDNWNEKYSTFDIKTHSSWADDITSKFQYKPQPLPYAIVLEQALERPIDDLEVHYLAAKVDIENPKIRKLSFKKTQEDVRDWAFDLWCDLQQISFFMQVGRWKRNGDACFSFNSACKFFDICHLRDPQAIQDEIELYNFQEMKQPEPWIKTRLEIADG